MDTYTIALQELRDRWKDDVENRRIIEIQAKLITMAQELNKKKNPPPQKTQLEEADKVFGK